MFDSDEKFMQEALRLAQIGAEAGEVPVGAILVQNEKIIASAHNKVESKQDSTCHAEIEVMRKAADQFKNWRLTGTTLYCTLEPCAMCAGAMTLFRIDRLVWGAKDLRHGGHGLLERHHPIHNFAVRGGVLAEESALLLKDFFKEKREAIH